MANVSKNQNKYSVTHPITIQDNIFCVIIKPNASKNEVVSYDSEQKIYHIHIHAEAKENKANQELIAFLKKITKKNPIIKSGKTSRKKLITLS